MKRVLVLSLAVLILIASNAFAGKFVVDGDNQGQFTDLFILGAPDSAKSGNDATIDLRNLGNESASGNTGVSISQADTGEALINAVCTPSGGDITCGTYTTTTGSKSGSIMIDLNGTPMWLWLYNKPN
jgi:hypothetical protein